MVKIVCELVKIVRVGVKIGAHPKVFHRGVAGGTEVHAVLELETHPQLLVTCPLLSSPSPRRAGLSGTRTLSHIIWSLLVLLYSNFPLVT